MNDTIDTCVCVCAFRGTRGAKAEETTGCDISDVARSGRSDGFRIARRRRAW